ncbi:MAG: tetrahydrofolate dehydrogenase/cyclohydrolase catalytic domain-containing protein [Bacilli bacterium]
MYIMDGKEVSLKIRKILKEEVISRGISPKLLVILVGDDMASQIYVKSKERACKKVGIEAETIVLDNNTSQKEVIDIINKANKDKSVNGILVQLPLPDYMDASAIVNAIDPLKDVDGLTVINQGKLVSKEYGIVPATPKGILALLKYYNVKLDGKDAIVIGRSQLVGKPVAALLLNENATVTMAHSHSNDLQNLCKNKDIIICAVGHAKLITADMVKEGAVVIDTGINRVHNTLVGDVDYLAVANKASRITPVPGGVGPMTVACLLQNIIECYNLQQK